MNDLITVGINRNVKGFPILRLILPQEIRKIDTEVVIIFITNMAQYAIRGYAVDALDYVLKPVSYFAFSQRLNRAISRIVCRISVCP